MLPEKNIPTYNTLEEIRLRKEQLSEAIEQDSEKIGTMWSQLFTKRENTTKAEYLTTIVTNSITAIDAFLLVRKLVKSYRGLFSFGDRNKKKGKRR
jgi:hypothetical protein